MRLLYWDASALLSVLIADAHSATARRYLNEQAHALLSTLAEAETRAVLRRMRHAGVLADSLHRSVLEVLDRGPWRRCAVQPDWRWIEELANRHVLKGADLWHLACVRTLAEDLPEVRLLTFDRQLAAAAHREGLAV